MDYNLVEIAKLEASIAGIFAGFALTVVVLLIDRLADKDKDIRFDQTLGEISILIFVMVLFVSVTAAFLFAVVAGEEQVSNRLAIMMLPASHGFALSSVLMALGVACVLGSHKLSYLIRPVQESFVFTAIAALIHYAYSAIGFVAAIYSIPVGDIILSPQVGVPFWGEPLLALIIAASVRQYVYRKKATTAYVAPGFHTFVYASIGSAAVCTVSMPIFTSLPLNGVIPVWVIFMFVVMLSVIIGWSLIYVPTNETEKHIG